MALKQIVLQKRITGLKSQLEELRKKDADFTARSEALKTREAELEAAVNELTEESTEEERNAVDESVAAFEADQETLASEQKDNEDAKSGLEGEINKLEADLEEINKKSADPPAPLQNKETVNRKDERKMENRSVFSERLTALIAREEVKDFLQRTRDFAGQKRTVTGADLLIPDVMLDILRDNISATSKLITKVNYKSLKGKARQNITGTVPEAVWTEMVGALNELEISFNQVEVDGYKVGGFIAVPNSTLQDSDIALASEIMTQISKAIGVALDKAILFGTGTKQPLGIVTRLAQASAPADYPVNAPAWADLRTTNISKVNTTGAALIGSIITAFGACKNDYSDGRKFFAMNSVTYAYLMSTLLNFNAAGALVTGMNSQMPILGGDIVILDFISNYDIIGGYGDLYLLAEREGMLLASSEHVKFVEDMTVFKGLARYDGLPVIAKGFFVINVKNADATTTKTFETDYANTEIGALAVTSAASATKSGDTVITVAGKEASGTTLAYRVAGKAISVANGDQPSGFTAWNGTDEITAATGKIITVIELNADSRAIKVGSCSVVAKA